MKCIYLLKKEWDEVFLKLLKDLANLIIDIYNVAKHMNMLSNFCSSTANKYDIKIGGINKWVPV